MVLKELQKKIFEYSKARDAVRVSVLRFLVASLKNKEIELRGEGQELSVEDAVKVTKKQIKQRKESVDIYAKAGREDLREKEAQELEVLEETLEFIESLREGAAENNPSDQA